MRLFSYRRGSAVSGSPPSCRRIGVGDTLTDPVHSPRPRAPAPAVRLVSTTRGGDVSEARRMSPARPVTVVTVSLRRPVPDLSPVAGPGVLRPVTLRIAPLRVRQDRVGGRGECRRGWSDCLGRRECVRVCAHAPRPDPRAPSRMPQWSWLRMFLCDVFCYHWAKLLRVTRRSSR